MQITNLKKFFNLELLSPRYKAGEVGASGSRFLDIAMTLKGRSAWLPAKAMKQSWLYGGTRLKLIPVLF